MANVLSSHIFCLHLQRQQPEFRCVLETVGPNGEFMDTMAGRLVTPGHAIEAGWLMLIECISLHLNVFLYLQFVWDHTAWFILQEGKLKNNEKYIQLGLTILGMFVSFSCYSCILCT